MSILHDVGGIIKPYRMTLLLDPPGSGKTTLQLELAGKLGSDLKVSGEVTYNGYELNEFVPERSAAYVQLQKRENRKIKTCISLNNSKFTFGSHSSIYRQQRSNQ